MDRRTADSVRCSGKQKDFQRHQPVRLDGDDLAARQNQLFRSPKTPHLRAPAMAHRCRHSVAAVAAAADSPCRPLTFLSLICFRVSFRSRRKRFRSTSWPERRARSPPTRTSKFQLTQSALELAAPTAPPSPSLPLASPSLLSSHKRFPHFSSRSQIPPLRVSSLLSVFCCK